ncbi:MAG TPA: C39 family peptidase [Patescibacteria group bacterium]|nr:C39 family peptidase [Patescibacteria group bacterium]
MKKILLQVKPFQETLNAGMCGPASLKIVLAYYGVHKSEKELARLCQHSKKLGVTNEQMEQAARSLGFRVTVKYQSTFKDIEQWLQKKVPVIVDWMTRGRADAPASEVAEGHSSVVVGLDDKYIYLQDPEIGALQTFTRHNFMKVWFDFKGEYIQPDELVIRYIMAIHK